MSMGTIRPVDSLAPKASAIKVTVIIAIPLIPALETPITKEAVNAKNQEVRLISKMVFSLVWAGFKARQRYLKKPYLYRSTKTKLCN